MTIAMSSEFTALCREQVSLLESRLGASPVVVYLAETFFGGEDNKLVPAIAEPDTSVAWDEVALTSDLSDRSNRPLLQLRSSQRDRHETLVLPSFETADEPHVEASDDEDDETYQLVVPLMHDNIAVGLLVTARSHQPWSRGDRDFVERIAHTIALACLMEQREQWLERNYRLSQQLQSQQHDLLHDWLHQFRNPLTALRIFGKLLVKQLHPDDERRPYADNIMRESQRLQDLLQDFRTAIDAEPFVLPSSVEIEDDPSPDSNPSTSRPLLPGTAESCETFHVIEVIEPLLHSVRAIASDRHIDFDAELSHELPPIRANRKALIEAIGNILDNALKYTPAGGRVRLDVGQNHHHHLGSGVAVAISDTGLGIPPADLEHLFERRFRGVQAQGDIPGTGLGLAIARELVRQMQGDIWAYSPPQHPGVEFQSDRGTTFIVWLPQASEDLAD